MSKVETKHQAFPGRAPPGATLCWKIVDPESVVPFTDERADCPECKRMEGIARKETNSRGVLKKGYQARGGA